MKNLMKRLFSEEEGQGMVEYGILLAGIAVIVSVAVWALGKQISGLFKDLATAIENVDAKKLVAKANNLL